MKRISPEKYEEIRNKNTDKDKEFINTSINNSLDFLNKVIISACSSRENFNKYKNTLEHSKYVHNKENLMQILSDIDQFYKENKSEQLSTDDFIGWAILSNKKSYRDNYDLNKFANYIDSDITEDQYNNIFNKIEIENAKIDLREFIQEHNEGANIDLFKQLYNRIMRLEDTLSRNTSFNAVDVSIEELIDEEKNNAGLVWRNNCLNDCMRPLRGGDFGILAARPDMGKSSFIASEITNFAKQLTNDRPVLWLNNEGPGRRIVARCWQAALKKSMSELVELNKEGKLNEQYEKETGGNKRLKVFDIHDLNSMEVEELIKREKPGLVVFDMIDNIKYAHDVSNNGQRTDQILENMYQQVRKWGVKYDCAMLATSQISVEGENVLFPNMSMLKDSKTGKQGAADFIIMLTGEQHDDDIRYISTTKNKLTQMGKKMFCKEKVVFNKTQCYFSDIDQYHNTQNDNTVDDDPFN